jgi:hypothetical protein
VITKLIEHGASVKNLNPATAVGGYRTSKDTLELLLAYGWDIDTRRSGSCPDAQPFLWHMVYGGDKGSWSLEHSASVHPKDQEPLRDDIITASQRSCPPILEKAAAWSSVDIFELLRSRGAPLRWRSLHLAIESATFEARQVD